MWLGTAGLLMWTDRPLTDSLTSTLTPGLADVSQTCAVWPDTVCRSYLAGCFTGGHLTTDHALLFYCTQARDTGLPTRDVHTPCFTSMHSHATATRRVACNIARTEG